MFLIKKIFSHMIYPVPLLILIAFIFLLILLLKKKKTILEKGMILFLLLLATLSFQPLSRMMAHSLERQYSKLDSIPFGYTTIVVLGGGTCSDSKVPISSQLSSASLTRLVEGISLLNQSDSTRLIVTGGSVLDTVTIASTQRKMAIALGVDSSRISMADKALDTEMEAQAVKKMVPDGKIILVTSAMHEPRAMAIFRKAGLNPIAAPTEFLSLDGPLAPADFFPSGRNMHVATVAWHEYLGLIWSLVRNRI